MDIEGLSEATLEVLIDKGWIKNFEDIYYLWDHKNEWIQLDGFGEKSVIKILDAIEKSRNVKLENFICALSIDGVGKSASKTISDALDGDFERLLSAFDNNFDWSTLEDVGDKTAQNISKYLTENIMEIIHLATEMEFVVQKKIETKENPFMGKSICCTGKLEHFTRDSINVKIVELGAKVASGVSAKTDYLITNTPESGSSKNVNAKKFGTKIITEQEFLNLIGE
jgi:DNA ligase (NAD+)